jgi:hypothetical protein
VVGDDIPLTKGFAQEGAIPETALGLAVLAMTISASASASFVLWYIAARPTIHVGVMNLLADWFGSFVNGEIRTYFSSHWLWSPVKDLGTPKVRPDTTTTILPRRHDVSTSRFGCG